MKSSSDSGYIIVMVAVFLVVMLALVALAVDMGVTYSARTQSQAAADAGALAGAVEFQNSLATKDTVENIAKTFAASDKTLGKAIATADVTATADMGNHRVTVSIERDEPTFFAKVVGVNAMHVKTTAIAEAATHSSSAPCVRPFFVPNGMVGASDACASCAAGQVLISGGNPTQFAKDHLGSEYVIKPQKPDDALVPSDFYAVAVGGSNSASDYRDAIGDCVPVQTLSCNMPYKVNPGDMKGPTKMGVDNLIGSPPTDHYVSLGVYRHADGHNYIDSRALITAPIADICGQPGFCPAGKFPKGSMVYLPIVGFAQWFVESVDMTAVTARLINVFACGTGVPDASGSDSNVPIRLVRAP